MNVHLLVISPYYNVSSFAYLGFFSMLRLAAMGYITPEITGDALSWTPRRDSAFGTVRLHAAGVWKRILRLSTQNRRFSEQMVANHESLCSQSPLGYINKYAYITRDNTESRG